MLTLLSCLNLWATADLSKMVGKVEPLIKDTSLEIVVTPPKGTKLNFDGPWKLKLADSLPTSKHKFSKKDFDKKLSRFRIPLSKNENIEGAYELTYFLCAEDNSWCRRLKDKGTIKGKVAGN